MANIEIAGNSSKMQEVNIFNKSYITCKFGCNVFIETFLTNSISEDVIVLFKA